MAPEDTGRYDGKPPIADRAQGAELAGRLLNDCVEAMFENSREIPDIAAFYYYQRKRGGGQLLIGRDGSVMFGISALSPTEMIAHFKDGNRTDISLFGIE
jgi:hypothetical protein